MISADLLLPPEIDPPATVVSLVPSVTETLFDLNLGPRVIGRTDYCVYPEGQVDHIPALGGPKTPAIDRILALRPELVIANAEENRREDVEALQAAGIPVWITFPRTVQELFAFFWDAMTLFDEGSMVPRIRLLEYTFDWLSNLSEHLEAPARVFVPIWLDPLMTVGRDTYVSDLLRVCGGLNVFGDPVEQAALFDGGGLTSARYPVVSWDQVEAVQPEVILLPSEPFAFGEEHLSLFTRLNVPAARAGRIHQIDGSFLTWHGTRIAHAFNTLPVLLQKDENAHG